jgi:hypothetical protein
MTESFCWACLRVCNSNLMILISDCNYGIVAMGWDFFFLLRIFVRSYVLVLVVGRMEWFWTSWGVSSLLKLFNSLFK